MPTAVAGDELPTLSGRIPTASAVRQDETDVIIIGSGAAGLSAALPLLDGHRRVTLITKGEPGDGSTAWAQGGLAAVLGTGDSAAGHVEDTLVAGAGLCEPDRVTELVEGAPVAIHRLAALGARFDEDGLGALALGLEGGHHARRIVHAGGDASGAEVARTLTTAVRARAATLQVLTHAVVVDLLRSATGAVCGVRLLQPDVPVVEIHASAVVLASGGIGQAWDTTTNPDTATGDGLALALRAGAVLRDVEFVQFHPTVLVVPPAHRRPGDRGVLVSEAVRGEGARVVDRHGTPVMRGRHPLADLAPRDVVAATMHDHLLATGEETLFLDGTHLGADVWRHHFPSILRLCRDRGVDPITEPIPVRPAEHYSCGGVLADLDGRTSVPGLYAVGEVASTGVQGANRLASNSLTEAIIAGDRVGRLLARRPPDPVEPITPSAADRPASALPAAARQSVVTAVSRGAGVQRDETGMTVLLKTLDSIEHSTAPAGVAEVEVTNLHTVGAVVAAAGLVRTESRGCHRRSDHRDRDPGQQHHTLIRLGPDGLEIRPPSRKDA